ncbi:hypothetical protein Tco_1474755 [Tanacetum coccineum]
MKDKMVYKGNNIIGALMNVPIFVETFSVVTDFVVLENMDDYRDERMGDVIFGEQFLREVGIKTRRFERMIAIYIGNDEVTYQIVRSHPRFKHHTNEQCNKIPPLLGISEEDKMNGISHPYQKLKGFYKGVLNLGPDYIRDAKMEEWLTRGHISVHDITTQEFSSNAKTILLLSQLHLIRSADLSIHYTWSFALHTICAMHLRAGSQFEGQLKEKTKVISDLKVKEGKDIDTMIEMEKQIKFLNEILYKRNQSIQTIHMLAPKCATYHGRSTFANPKYCKKAQSDKPCLYEIPYDTSDPANRFAPDGEDTVTLEKESRSKLDKDKVKPYNYTYQNSLYETFKPPSKAYLDQLERAKEVRKTMWRKTFVRTKPNIAKNIGFLPMSKSISKSRLLYNEMTNNFNHFRTICQQTWSNHTSSAFPNPTAKSMEVLIKILLMPLSDKTILDSHCFIHELKKEMNDDLEYVNSLEKELDELESEKADFSNIYDLLLEECVSKDVTCSYLHSLSDLNANTELQCLYLHKVKECECLAQKLSKQTESVNKEMKNNPVCKENASNVFRKEREQYHEIQDLKAQMQDKNMVINELKKLILVTKGKSVETQFDKPSVVRQPNAQRIPKPSVLGKPTPFSNSPEMRSFQTKQSVNKTNVSDGLFKQVTQQNLPQNRKQAEIHSNVLKPGMYRIATTTTQNREPQLPHASRNTNPHVSKSSGVNHTTSVSRPQLKCYQVKDKVVPNNSQVKFQKKEVEDHHRISSISKKTKSVTACNDSSNSRTSNVNAVCAECGKCVFNSNHDACVSKYLKDVNARTKKPKVVPISASKPKRKANKSVATPHKKTVASDTTIQKSKSYYKKLYENTNQEWRWWIAKRCPSDYTWTQKPLRTKRIWMPKIRKDDESTSISPTIDIVSRITNIVQLILFIVDSGCTKHMTGNLKLLCNFVEKFLGTVHFGNDQFAPILGYGDLIQGNVTIKRVYYVEGLNHNLFSVGQFCDADLEVAFRKSTCFVRDLQGNDLLTGSWI